VKVAMATGLWGRAFRLPGGGFSTMLSIFLNAAILRIDEASIPMAVFDF